MSSQKWRAVTAVDDLRALYGACAPASLVKVAGHITPEYRKLLEASPFFAIATAGPDGLDCSPRGELGGAFRIHDETTILIPDRRGNNRIDTLANIVRDPRIALLFLIPGSNTTVRINGSAIVTVDPHLCESFVRDGKVPRSVVVVTISEVYFQCGRAVIRAGLWDSANHVNANDLPTAGEVLAAQSSGEVGGKSYDEAWQARADATMW